MPDGTIVDETAELFAQKETLQRDGWVRLLIDDYDQDPNTVWVVSMLETEAGEENVIACMQLSGAVSFDDEPARYQYQYFHSQTAPEDVSTSIADDDASEREAVDVLETINAHTSLEAQRGWVHPDFQRSLVYSQLLLTMAEFVQSQSLTLHTTQHVEKLQRYFADRLGLIDTALDIVYGDPELISKENQPARLMTLPDLAFMERFIHNVKQVIAHKRKKQGKAVVHTFDSEPEVLLCGDAPYTQPTEVASSML